MKATFSLLLALGAIGLAGCGEPPAGSPASVSSENASVRNSGEAAKAVWLTDYAAAKSLAEQEQKIILMNFTGSDWCAPCMQLKKDLFNTPEFARYAEEHLVLLELDFPRRKPQPEDLMQQNHRLHDDLSIESVPTLILLDSSAREIDRWEGYMPGGPKRFQSWVEQSRGKSATSAGNPN